MHVYLYVTPSYENIFSWHMPERKTLLPQEKLRQAASKGCRKMAQNVAALAKSSCTMTCRQPVACASLWPGQDNDDDVAASTAAAGATLATKSHRSIKTKSLRPKNV